jgi:type I restriction enzyme M protein
MAIAEKLGKDRRGNPIYVRDEDGAEVLYVVENKYLAYEKETPIVKMRVEKQRLLDDDLPKIAKAYNDFLIQN